jgi:basic membrane protein A
MKGIALAMLAGATAVALVGGAGAANKPLRVALVLEPGMRNVPIGMASIEGLRNAVETLGISGRVVSANTKEPFTTTLSRLAAQRYDLILPAGSVAQDATGKTAATFPRTKFGMLDVPIEFLKSRPPNVMGTEFRKEQAAFIAGYLAALVEQRRQGPDVVSSVGGAKFFGVDSLIAGYEAGARRAVPGIKILHSYANSFDDPAKCKRVAQAQIEKGSHVVFQVAGRCGDGALEAAKEKGVWGIGVDRDQSPLGPHILTSVLAGGKGEHVYRLVEALLKGRFRGGRNLVLDLRNQGVGLGKVSPRVPRDLLDRVERVRRQIVSGAIGNIPTTVS